MKKHYDFSKSKPNPYIRKAKRQVTIRLDEATIQYFRALRAVLEFPIRT